MQGITRLKREDGNVSQAKPPGTDADDMFITVEFFFIAAVDFDRSGRKAGSRKVAEAGTAKKQSRKKKTDGKFSGKGVKTG